MSTKNERIRIYVWLGLLAVTCVAADGGDDFSNNLFSDLSPLLALFGERVTMQFMSGSMGWADNIILAMAPLGILTIVVSAIRVGGPSWLKALIGRAWENLSAAEVELMSSTSEEVCELWNGRGLVRCMGSAPIVEFICLPPKTDKPDAEAPLTRHWHSSTKPRSFRNFFKSIYRLPEKPKPDTEKSSPIELQSSSKKANSFCIETTQLETVLHEIGNAGTTFDSRDVCLTQQAVVESRNTSSSAERQQALSETSNNSLQKFYVTRNLDNGSPNVSLNIHGPSSKYELVLAAICGTILQIGVLVYGWFATYYASLKFPKDDKPVASYAYPCTAVGTLLLVCGIAECGHVVDSSTKEREFKAKDERELRVIWLQQQKTVSDQFFKSCAIYAKEPQLSIKSSRRDSRTEHQDQKEVNWSLSALETKTILGTAVTLSGFVLQFVGLRGMHWSISIAQLGAVLVMIMLKALVRRRLADPPRIQELVPGFELDWLARTLGNEGYAKFWHWGGRDQQNGSLHDWIILSDEETKLKDVEKRSDNPPPETEDPSASRSTGDGSGGFEGTVEETTVSAPLVSSARYADPQDKGAGNAKSQYVQRCAQAILFARKELGSLSNWHGFAYDEAVCLSRAIQITMNTLFASTDQVDWEWRITVQCDDSEDKRNVGLKLCRENDNWKVELNEIDAALSLWLSSTNVQSGRNMESAEFNAEEKTQSSPGSLSRSLKNEAIDRSQLNVPSAVRGKRSLGVCEPWIQQDLEWWVPRDLLRTFEVDEADPELLQIVNSRGSQPSSQNETRQAQGTPKEGDSSGHAQNNIGKQNTTGSTDSKKLLAINFQASQKMLCAHSLFSLFMRAVAEKLKDPVKGGVDELLSESDTRDGDWKKFQLRNNTLSRMVQDVHQTGLGSLGDIYTSIVAPLSREKKLPQLEKVVEWAREHAEKYARLEDWKRTEECLTWLSTVAETSYTAAKAEGILMDHLRRVISVREFHEEQGFTVDESLMGLQRTLEGECDSRRIRGPEQKPINSNIEDLARLFTFDFVGLGTPRLFYIFGKFQPHRDAIMFPEAFNFTDWHYRALQDEFGLLEIPQSSPKGHANAKDILDRTAAHYHAVTQGLTIEQLKKNGADLNAQDLLGWTPLHYACQAGSNSVIAELVQAGVGLDHQARDEATPLHCAISSGSLEGVRLLVEAGATVDMRNSQRSLPIHLATYRGHDEIVGILLKGGSRNLRDRFGRTALHQAALADMKNAMDVLLANDAFAKDLEVRDRYGQTPLSLATKMGHLDCMKALLDKGADKNSQNYRQETILYRAAESGQIECVRILLDELVDAKLQEFSGEIPLHAAAQSGNLEIVQLLEKHSDINSQAHQTGWTPLMRAARYGRTEIIKHLIENGADHQRRNYLGQTALHHAIMQGAFEPIETLIRLGADIEATEKRGLTPLMYAIYWDNPRAIDLLLKKGAKIEATDTKGRTPLILAAEEGRIDAIKQLLARGAKVDATDAKRRTALIYAAEKDKIDAVKQLLARGANIEATDTEGRTALSVASGEEVRDLLQSAGERATASNSG